MKEWAQTFAVVGVVAILVFGMVSCVDNAGKSENEHYKICVESGRCK